MRVTILCPETQAALAAPFLICKSPSPSDVLRFPAIRWADSGGGRFQAASFEAKEDAAAHWTAPPTAPDWSALTDAEMAAALACHAGLTLVQPGTALTVPSPTGLTVILGPTGGEVLDSCGLRQDLPEDI